MLPFPEEPVPLRDLAYAVLDLETTGFSPKGGWTREERFHPAAEITEVGVVLLAGAVIQDRWESLCAIEGRLPANIQRLTGITLPMLATAPCWEHVALDLATRLDGRIWVAHHAPFDGSFLKALLPAGLWKRHTLLCTRRLAQTLIPEAPSRRLVDLCAFLSIHNRRAHRALADAEATAELLQILMDRAETQGMDSDAFIAEGRVPWESL